MPQYYEIEVALRRLKPRIWRRFLLRKTGTFADLHFAIQAAFEWDDDHLWDFRSPGRNSEPIAGIPGDGYFEAHAPDAYGVKLSSVLVGGVSGVQCRYLYDFGDSWDHDVKVRKIVTDKETFTRRLLAGRRACPQEDSGGSPGHARMVEFAKTGKDPWGEDDEYLAGWLKDWDPERFDLAAARQQFDG